LAQFSVGNGANPQDIAFASATKAYVTRFESSDLWIVNPATGAHTGTISLAAFADADGIPEMDRLEMVGPLLFVSLERLDRNHGFAPTDTALVAVIDTRADTLVDCDPVLPGTQAIRLPLANPFTPFQFDPATSRLLIGCAGAFGVLDGGVARIDPVRLVADGVAITEAALGGDVDDIAWGNAQTSWAIVADSSGNTRLVSWSAATGTALATLWNPGGYVLTDAELDDRGGLWVCEDSFTTPRVRVFATATGLPAGSDVVCALPPVSLAFDAPGDLVTAVPDATAPPLALAGAAPDPARRATAFAFTLPAGARVRLEVLDAAGRRIRTLADGAWPAGAWSLAWDLADDAGARVPPGVYFARLQAAGGARTRPVVVLP